MMNSDKAREVIQNATAGEYDFHDTKRIIVKSEVLKEAFKNVKIYPWQVTNANGKRAFVDTKHESAKCFVSVKNNKRYGNHIENEKYLDFNDDFKAYAPETELIEAMKIFGCTVHDTPSIEFIQWEDNFLMLVKSRNCIGEYKSFVDKKTVFEIFNIEVVGGGTL